VTKVTKNRTFEPHQSQKRASPLFTRKQLEHVIRASYSLGSGGADTFDGTCCKHNFEKVYFFRFFFNGYKYEHTFAMPAGGERREICA
jgi:hypothetical protein